MPALLHFGNSTTSGALGVKCLQLSLHDSDKLCISSCISCFSSVQAFDRTCQRSTQTYQLGGTMLGRGSLATHSSLHVGRCSSVLSSHKRSYCGCFGRPCVQRFAIYFHLSLWLLRDVCCTDRGSLPQSVRQCWGQLNHLMMKVYQPCWKEWAGWCS